MKNLFHYLASALAQSVSNIFYHSNNTQNKHSTHLLPTFLTPTGDQLQVYEQYEADCLFGVIQIQLGQPYIYLNDAAAVLHNFLGSLEHPFKIVCTTQADYTFNKRENEHFTTVYWQDTNFTDWKVRGWTNRNVIAVRYIKNINTLPISKEEAFLGSIQRLTA